MKNLLVFVLLLISVAAFASLPDSTAAKPKKKGKPFPDVTFYDMQGKPVSLKTLKGSYIYVDVWAQWCGPCKEEIPNLQKLEEKYKDANIKFVSISIDKQDDTDKWKLYVVSNHLGGLQLNVDKDWGSEFCTWFHITSIPRFMLIDPDGYVIDSSARRPSNSLLPKQIDGLLASATLSPN